MNNVYLTGYLAQDVQMRKTTSGKTVGTFNLAVKKRKKEEAIFIPIITWESLAELCGKYIKKGSKVLISGELNIRSYENKEGIRRWITEITANSVEFMDRKIKDENIAIEERDFPAAETDVPAIDDDEYPF